MLGLGAVVLELVEVVRDLTRGRMKEEEVPKVNFAPGEGGGGTRSHKSQV